MARRVLVVEDDPAQRRFLERALGASGWRVTLAPDGEAGLRQAQADPPDVILLDVMLPGLNGFQACRRIREDAALRQTPVVILTAKDQPTDELWAREVGADAFLSKPVQVAELLSLLEGLEARP